MRNAFRNIAAVLAFVLASGGMAMVAEAAGRQGGEVYATAQLARKAGPDFDIQGEYEGTAGGGKIGVQVIALGGGQFQAVFLPGGLPGAGWDGKTKILCQGKPSGGKVLFTPAKGPRQYMAGNPAQFSAAQQFPPAGQKDYTATIADGKLTGKADTGQAIEAAKVHRESPTLGAKPAEGALVLLAFEPDKAPSLDAWTNTKWQAEKDGRMQAVSKGGSTRTKRTFSGAWKLHIEFTPPFVPRARSQGRGNSGVYMPGGREVQVLDSFGLQGLANECGGIYKTNLPRVNMCLPPLSWQTYDITCHPARDGQQAWCEVVHNGVVIHEKIELGGGPRGPLNLQDHGNPVSYRNIWIVLGDAALQ